MLAMPNLIVRHRIRCYSLRNSLGKNGAFLECLILFELHCWSFS